MTSFPRSPRLLRAGLVLIDPATEALERVITLQYNPASLTRTLQAQYTGSEGGDRSEALRLTGAPVETLKLEAELDAADQLEVPDRNRDIVEHGIQPMLTAIETVLYPPSARLIENDRLAGMGTLEVAPVQAPLSLFVWSKNRILPVRITEFSATEEAFDPSLNPIRARVSLGMRVLSVDDLGFNHKGGSIYLAYQQQKERLARLAGGDIGTLGLGGVP